MAKKFLDKNGNRVYEILGLIGVEQARHIWRNIYKTGHNNSRHILRGVSNSKSRIVYAVAVRRFQDGPVEYHFLTEDGGVFIFQDSKWVHGKYSIVTQMYLRPAQVRRLFVDGNAPERIINVCRNNMNEYPELFQ